MEEEKQYRNFISKEFHEGWKEAEETDNEAKSKVALVGVCQYYNYCLQWLCENKTTSDNVVTVSSEVSQLAWGIICLRFCSISYELLQYWERLLTSGTTPVDLRRANMENEVCLAPDFLNIGRSTQKMACWTPRDKKLYVEQYVSGHEGLFLTHGVRIHTNHLQRCTQSRKCMHVFTLEVYMWIRFYWIKGHFYFRARAHELIFIPCSSVRKRIS